MIVVTNAGCDRSHARDNIDRAGQEFVMASHPLGPNPAMPPSEWNSSAHVYTRSQLMAFMRASVIALVLLGVLALIILF
jgi:hypothetical protein